MSLKILSSRNPIYPQFDTVIDLERKETYALENVFIYSSPWNGIGRRIRGQELGIRYKQLF